MDTYTDLNSDESMIDEQLALMDQADKRCNTCASCDWVNRWEAIYRDHLRKNPGSEEFINEERAADQRIMTCLRRVA